MSSDIANIPPWKVALMEQKRRRQEPSNDGKQEQSLDMTGLPAWKLEVLAKKQQQRNSVIFVARPAAKDVELDSNAGNSVNGHDVSKRRSCMPKIDLSGLQHSVKESVETAQSNGFDDRPMEERLLPIHRNPILRNDLQKRHSSNGSQRNSWSPRSLTDSSHSSSGSNTRHPIGEGIDKVASPEVLSCGDNYGEVFGTDETEVTYGKGFVHKLLVKFSNLSVSDQSAASNRQSLGSLSTSPSHSHAKSPLADAESLSMRPRQSSPRAKYHSVDDLLSDSNSQHKTEQQLLSQQSANGVCNGDLKLMNGDSEYLNGSVPSLSSFQRCTSLSEDEDLPLQNIVSNTRSMFEHLSSSSSRHLKAGTSSHGNARTAGVSNNRFSFVGLTDKAQPKTADAGNSTALIKVVEQTKHDERAGKKTHVEPVVNQKSNGLVKSVSDGNIGTIVYSDMSVKGGNSLPAKPTISSHSYDNESSIKDENDNSSKLTVPGKHVSASLSNGGAKAPEVSKPVLTVQRNSEASSSSLLNDFASKTDVDVVPNDAVGRPSSNPAYSNALASQTVVNKSSTIMSKTASNHSVSTSVEPEKPSKSQAPVSTNKAGPSRPGKLLIRPASNLVAAKTNTEYLSLTKYNDVRKGEFAPAARKPVDDVADDDTIDAYENGESNEVLTNNSVGEKFEFSGAGVRIGRSLLDKTKQGKRLSINFDDAQTTTFEYPSEQSLMDATPAQPGDCDFEGETPDYGSSSGLRSAPISGTSAAALSSYRSRMQVDYQFGMHIEEKPKPESLPLPTVTKSVAPDPVKSPDKPDSPVWSKGASSDLLF